MIRREPFRLLFPLGALLAWAGVAPWVLFGTGLSRLWLGTYHAFTLTQGFLLAVAAGFLGTMIPRRTGGRPLSTWELGAIAAGLVTLPIALFFDRIAIAEGGYLLALAVLAVYAIGRLRRSDRPIPPSFTLIPLALVAGSVGAILLALGIGMGRPLVEEGVLLPLVLALGPMLTPIILDGAQPTTPAARYARLLHVCLGGALVAGFVIQALGADRVGLFLRGSVALVGVVVVSNVVRRPRVPGLHRRVYQIAMLLVPTGLMAAALQPVHRVAFLHLTFIGGLSLLIFAVSMHVSMLHTGREALARRSPWPVAFIAVLTLAAMTIRAGAEHLPQHYVDCLGIASSLWLIGAIVWAGWLTPMFFGRRA